MRDAADTCKVSPRLAGGYQGGYRSQAKAWVPLNGLVCGSLEGMMMLAMELNVSGVLSRLRGPCDSIYFVSCAMISLTFSLTDILLTPLKFFESQRSA